MFNTLARSLLGYKNMVQFPMSSSPTVVEGSADNREPPRLHLFNTCVQNQEKKWLRFAERIHAGYGFTCEICNFI